ncbi:MAG: transglutaminase-like domain-containing protein [Rhodospirillaceae bacterium]|nr:transglutaminase-like domain-containing protein [Rhodospirillaceae bacterium]
MKAVLRDLVAQDDSEIDLAEAALVLASFDHPAADLEVYRDHLRALAKAVADAADEQGLDADAAPEDIADILRHVLAEDFRYTGDEDTYNDLDNANLMRVIERRKGLPVSLGILYLFAARAQGWSATGLNFPGHFLIRLESSDGQRVIIDPFYNGRSLEIQSLRELLKVVRGAAEELDASHYQPVSNREILIRLQNNVKTRRLEQNEVAGALEALDAMQTLDPANAAFWREAGVMHMRLGHLKHAVESFESFIAKAPDGPDRRKIADVVQELRERLH